MCVTSREDRFYAVLPLWNWYLAFWFSTQCKRFVFFIYVVNGLPLRFFRLFFFSLHFRILHRKEFSLFCLPMIFKPVMCERNGNDVFCHSLFLRFGHIFLFSVAWVFLHHRHLKPHHGVNSRKVTLASGHWLPSVAMWNVGQPYT